MSIISQVIMDVLLNKNFRIMMSNVSNKQIHIQKRMHVALGIDVPQIIVTFTEVDEIKTVSAISIK